LLVSRHIKASAVVQIAEDDRMCRYAFHFDHPQPDS
jgi:hypothetical protein